MLTIACLLALSSLSTESRIAALVSTDGGVSPAQWASLGQGRIVTKTLDTGDRSEVVTLAVVRVRAGRERFLACSRDPSCLRQNEDAIGAGRLGATPGPDELTGLSLDARDVEHLRRCRPGDCDVRLGRDAITRFQREVDWSAPTHPPAASALFRELLAERAVAYAAHGAASLPAYDDNPVPVSVAETLSGLLRRRFFPLDVVPDAGARIASAPLEARGPDEFLYWYKERFWRKSLVALCHVSVITAEDGASDLALLVSRQIYASHYFDGAVDVSLFVGPAGEGDGLLVFLSRARADIRPSGFTWLERLLINRLVRRRMEGQLRSMRDRLQEDDGKRAAGTQTPAGPDSHPGSPHR